LREHRTEVEMQWRGIGVAVILDAIVIVVGLILG
jgi:hypothetical protein